MTRTTLEAFSVGAPRTLDASTNTCRCVGSHVPKPRILHEHHIIPLAWGGADSKINTVALCPTAHANVHRLLTEWARAKSQQPIGSGGNRFIYALAARAWQHRPT